MFYDFDSESNYLSDVAAQGVDFNKDKLKGKPLSFAGPTGIYVVTGIKTL